MVMLQGVPPERIQAQGTLGLPVCLVFIEVSSAGLAHLVRDCLAPGQPGLALWVVVQNINQQRQLATLGYAAKCLEALGRCQCRFRRNGELGQGVLEVICANAAS